MPSEDTHTRCRWFDGAGKVSTVEDGPVGCLKRIGLGTRVPSV
uniref:Uncharacterized protein n=1 Tax=Anopheles arabiensis TaxID=7173 RepID=A0A182IH81_ANOAR